MIQKSRRAALFFMPLFVSLAMPAFSQNASVPAATPQERLAFYFGKFRNGMDYYQQSQWLEAAAEFRAAQEASGSERELSEALYWVILCELAASDYSSALMDMDTLEKNAPASGRAADLVYHRARAYYYLGRFEDALPLFKQYSDSSGPGGESRKAAAIYWMGECLYSLGQLEQAAGFFRLITEDYPASPKYEASVYRLDLIKQKKIETELLALLKWSHEESLRSSEEYQRKEKTYEQAMSAYQRRIAELLRDTRVSDLENSNSEYRRRLAEAESRIRTLEGRSAEGRSIEGRSAPEDDGLKERALQLRGELQWDLNNPENGGRP